MTTLTTSATLTLPEARAIVRYGNWGGRVTDALYANALTIVKAHELPVVTYAPMDWNEDDGSEPEFEFEAKNERAEERQSAIEWQDYLDGRR